MIIIAILFLSERERAALHLKLRISVFQTMKKTLKYCAIQSQNVVNNSRNPEKPFHPPQNSTFQWKSKVWQISVQVLSGFWNIHGYIMKPKTVFFIANHYFSTVYQISKKSHFSSLHFNLLTFITRLNFHAKNFHQKSNETIWQFFMTLWNLSCKIRHPLILLHF